MSDPPSSDAPLLAGLSAAVAAMVGLGILMYWAMQPTVLPNAPYESAADAKQSPIVLQAQETVLVDIERSAVAMAARENELQGLRPIAAAKTKTEPAPTQALAQAIPKAAKPKRVVARAPRRDVERERTYANNWWGGGHSFFGGFGNW